MGKTRIKHTLKYWICRLRKTHCAFWVFNKGTWPLWNLFGNQRPLESYGNTLGIAIDLLPQRCSHTYVHELVFVPWLLWEPRWGHWCKSFLSRRNGGTCKKQSALPFLHSRHLNYAQWFPFSLVTHLEVCRIQEILSWSQPHGVSRPARGRLDSCEDLGQDSDPRWGLDSLNNWTEYLTSLLNYQVPFSCDWTHRNAIL